jgi:hypothetical protein
MTHRAMHQRLGTFELDGFRRLRPPDGRRTAS